MDAFDGLDASPPCSPPAVARSSARHHDAFVDLHPGPREGVQCVQSDRTALGHGMTASIEVLSGTSAGRGIMVVREMDNGTLR